MAGVDPSPKVIEDEPSLNTPLDGGETSVETSITSQQNSLDFLIREVKSLCVGFGGMARTLNGAVVKLKDLDSRLHQMSELQNGINAKLERVDTLLAETKEPNDPKCGSGSAGKRAQGGAGGPTGGTKTCGRAKKGKQTAAVLAKDIMNIEFDVPEGSQEKPVQVEKEVPEEPETTPLSTPKSVSGNSEIRPSVNSRFTKGLRSVPVTQGIIGAFRRKEMDQTSKALFTTPPSTGRVTKVRRLVQTCSVSTKEMAPTTEVSPTSRTNSSVVSPQCRIRPFPAIVIPKGTNSKFSVTPSMKLGLCESQVATYLYEEGLDPEEPILKMYTMSAVRKDFDCLIPGKQISKQIMNLIAFKITLSQTYHIPTTVWCLPASFMDDVYGGKSTEELVRLYLGRWMFPYNTLGYIYVPLLTSAGHWFLMVISLVDKVVYQFDSNLNIEDIPSRMQTMKTMCSVILDMISTTDHTEASWFPKMVDFHAWDVQEARGVPNTGSSENSCVWVISWLEMEAGFHANRVGIPDFDRVRMETATNLLCGEHNDLRRSVEDRAVLLWNSLIARQH